MASEWEQVKVGDLLANGALAINDGYRVRNVELGREGIPFVRGGDIGDGTINFEVEDRIQPQFTERVRSKLTRPYDVAFITKGTVGRVGLVRPNQPEGVFAPQVCYWRSLDWDVVDPRFLYYLLTSAEFQANLDAVKTHGSMVADYVSMTDQKNFRLTFPSIGNQRAIGRILGTLDDKIELNQRMNATLEAMSRAIFKSWFVDFDPVRQKAAGKQPVGMDAQTAALFPDSFEDSEIGEVPKGWRVGPLSRFFTIGLGGAWGDEGPTEKSSQAVHCLRGIDCHDLAEGLLPEVPSRWISPKQCSDRLLTDGTILVEGSGSFCGRSLCWRPEYESLVAPPVVYSNFCKRLSPQCSPSQAHIIWCQMRAAYASGEFAAFRVGTAFPNFDMQGAMDNFRVVVPPDTLAQRYATIAWQSQRLDLTRQSRTLAALRDTLLPKLLSGEVRVPEAEEAVA
jgi:type I restriction enzyme S subunit